MSASPRPWYEVVPLRLPVGGCPWLEMPHTTYERFTSRAPPHDSQQTSASFESKSPQQVVICAIRLHEHARPISARVERERVREPHAVDRAELDVHAVPHFGKKVLEQPLLLAPLTLRRLALSRVVEPHRVHPARLAVVEAGRRGQQGSQHAVEHAKIGPPPKPSQRATQFEEKTLFTGARSHLAQDDARPNNLRLWRGTP